jgi:hypothetical protein
MRLSKIEKGESFLQRLKLGVMRVQIGERAPDVAARAA